MNFDEELNECGAGKRSEQVQYDYSTAAIQEFFLYCSCIALVGTAAIQHNLCVILL